MKQAHPALERFIRDTLGCGCPASVLEHIDVAALPAGFSRWGDGRLLRVGGRLLVLLMLEPEWRRVEEELSLVFEAGRRLRDADDWNRFRLVVVTGEPGAALALEAAFAALSLPDDRLHLHVIPPTAVPSLDTDGTST